MRGNLAPILLFGYGNPGRGDDALGPLLLDAIAAQGLPGVECQTDMQLQVEHITDLVGREYILFMDADMSCAKPYVLDDLTAQQDCSYTSHAMSPAAVIHAFRQVYGRDAPPAYLLRIRGYSFELGDSLTGQAASNLAAAMHLVETLCKHPDQFTTAKATKWPESSHIRSADSVARPSADNQPSGNHPARTPSDWSGSQSA